MIKHFRVAASLAAKLEESGVRVAAVLRHARLPPDLFQQTRILVTTEELFALWRSIGEVSNDPAIGLKLGAETRLDRFHPMSIAALATDNFGAAIEHMARYKRLCAPEEIVHQMTDDEWSIQFRWTQAVEAEPQVLIDVCFAWVLTIARHGSGTRITPLRVEFVQPRTILKTLERHFGCPVFCGAPRNAIIFRATDSQCPFVTRNLELLDMLAPQLEQQLNQHKRAEDTFIEQVRVTIQQKLTGHRPTTEDVARELHLSSRTLQRRLQESGSSFQQLLDQARHQMARYYLSNSVLELNEAAYLLGYEDTNSFARAFRSWEGMPPSHWREVNRASAVN
jgi:AraC-like DNA-binding protein